MRILGRDVTVDPAPAGEGMVSLARAIADAPEARAETIRTASGVGAADATRLAALAALQQIAGAVEAGATAAVESVAARVGNAFAAARAGHPALTPAVLATMARWTAVSGDALWVGELAGPPSRRRVELLPAAGWDVHGGSAVEDDWTYHATINTPSGAVTRTRRREGVLHLRLSTPPGAPYRGASPLDSARLTAELAALCERALRDEMLIPAAALIPVPAGNELFGEELRERVRGMSARVLTPVTTQGGAGAARGAAPQTDWKALRLGPAPPAALVDLAKRSAASVVAALGVSPALVGDGENTGASREARRQFQTDLLEPLAALISAEASRYFGRPVPVRFPPRSDVVLLVARAAKTYMDMGFAPRDAVRMAGYEGEVPEPAPRPAPEVEL